VIRPYRINLHEGVAMRLARTQLLAVGALACTLSLGAQRASAQGTITGRVVAQGSSEPLQE
jgi:hypothetical protein